MMHSVGELHLSSLPDIICTPLMLVAPDAMHYEQVYSIGEGMSSSLGSGPLCEYLNSSRLFIVI